MNYTMFACGPGAELMIIVYGVFALLIVSGGLFVANLCLLFALRDGSLLRNGSALLLYSAFGLVAYNQVKSGADHGFFLLAGVIGVPAIVIVHFIRLVRQVRRERRALRNLPQPS